MSNSAYLPYLMGISIILMIVLRVMRRKRIGSAAVKFEVLYLMAYSFLFGVLVTFFLEHQDIGWMAILISATFFVGFFVRTMPLFRLIREVEDKAEGRF